MNQLVGKDVHGNAVLVLVLEPGNIIRMTAEAKPIEKRIEDMFPDGIPRKLTLVIAYSETPVADARKFRGMAPVTLDERTPKMATKRPHCPECRSTIEQLGVWRNESPMAIAYCVMCGCVFGMVPQEVAKQLKAGA